MEKIGIFIETKDKEIKKAIFGVIAGVRGEGFELYAFVLDGNAESYKESLQEFGINKVVDLSADSPTAEYDPEVYAGAMVDVFAPLAKLEIFQRNVVPLSQSLEFGVFLPDLPQIISVDTT